MKLTSQSLFRTLHFFHFGVQCFALGLDHSDTRAAKERQNVCLKWRMAATYRTLLIDGIPAAQS